jgi:cell division protein FtsI/penicillin-binding protein 2
MALALVALVMGIVVGSRPSDNERAARQFTEAWERGDYGAMHALLTPAAQKRTPRAVFERSYRQAAAAATTAQIRAGDGGERVPVTVVTRAFGTIERELELPMTDGRVDWRPHLVFPGMPEGATLTRRTAMPPRAKIVARDGRPIVSGVGPGRVAAPGPASSIAGEMGLPKTQAERDAAYARGLPVGTPVGLSGLERALEREVTGTPGGTLSAGRETLASTRPRAAQTVRSTIDLDVQAAAVQALAGRFGGIAALDARTAEVRALAGVAFSAPQPPGSTFKIITASAGLEAGLVKPSTRFPVSTKAVIDGVDLENANGESCGGTFVDSFAESCNSVFAPLGVKLGAQRLVGAAERFGFNRPPAIAGAAMSSLPPAAAIDSPLAVGSTAIGQGKVLATPLQMALIAHTIATGGVQRVPTLLQGKAHGAGMRVIAKRVARTVERMMIAVVQRGTGTAASLAPISVAGKTGTAELEDTTDNQPPTDVVVNPGHDTDAWFAAYAPTRRPRLAVGVLFVRAGAGGQTAAPAARIVLQAGLRATARDKPADLSR